MSDHLRPITELGCAVLPECTVDSGEFLASSQTTLLYYDTETTGTDPGHDRILQLAAIRRRLADGQTLQRWSTLCRPSADTALSEIAFGIHGISLSEATAKGMPEPELADAVHRMMSQPATVSVGYNSTRFDSPFIRSLLYRNFLDAYAHEWADDCNRWDLLDVVRTFHALAPNSLQWRPDGKGGSSLSLVDVAAAAGLGTFEAHDALADTTALADVDAVLRGVSMGLWRAAFSRCRREFVEQDVGIGWRPKPMLLVTGVVPAAQRCLAFVAPIAPRSATRGLVWNLREDPRCLLDLTPEQIADRFYTRGDTPRLFFHIATNRNPQIFPLDQDQAGSLLTDETLKQVDANLRLLTDIQDTVRPKIRRALRMASGVRPDGDSDVDAAIYARFFSDPDRRLVQTARSEGPSQLADLMRCGEFDDPRTPELLWRYVARHHPEQLTAAEAGRWEQEVAQRLAFHGSRYAAEGTA